MKRSLTFYMTCLVILVAIALAFAASFFAKAIYIDGVVNRARTVSENVNAFGAWVSKYGRVYVKDGSNNSYLGHEMYKTLKPSSSALTEGKLTDDDLETLNLYSKNPALAQREFSEAVQKSEAKAKFRLTSHNVMNLANSPDEFEKKVMGRMRTEGLTEYSEVVGKELRYASILMMKESCLKCHASASAAPKDVIDRYGSTAGYGFKVGDMAGIISVRVPIDLSFATFFKQFNSMGAMAYVAVALVLFALMLPLMFLKMGIINKIQKMTQFSESASLGRASNDELNIPQDSKNELASLGASIKRMNSSLQIAISKLKDEKK